MTLLTYAPAVPATTTTILLTMIFEGVLLTQSLVVTPGKYGFLDKATVAPVAVSGRVTLSDFLFLPVASAL